MENRSGQVGVEFMLVVALVLIIFVPLFVFLTRSSVSSTDKITEASVTSLVTQIRDQARDTYYSGTYNKKTLTVTIPQTLWTLSVINATPSGGATATDPSRYYLEARYNVSAGERTTRVSSEVPLNVPSASCTTNVPGCLPNYDCERCPLPGLRSGAQQEIELRTAGGPVNLSVVTPVV